MTARTARPSPRPLTAATTYARLPRLSPWLVVAGSVLGAALLGLAVTHDPRFGVLAVGGMVFAVFVVVDLPVAVAVWIVALYLAGVPGTSGAPTGTTVVLVAGCLGTIVDRRAFALRSFRHVRWAYLSTVLVVLWSGFTILWAPDPAIVRSELQIYVVAAIALPLIVTSCTNVRAVLVVASGFVAGAVCGVAAGVLTGTSAAPASRLASFEAAAGRLHSGNNDPNYLAADIVAALLVVAGLLAVRELRRWRPVLLLAVPILLAGLVGTQSRGGIIALAAAVVLAPIVLREHRGRLLAGIGIVLLLVGAFLVAQPRAVDRLTQDDSTGTGRTQLWHAAALVARDHPLGGVGPGNFQVVERRYVDQLGFVEDPAMLVATPHVAHNIWLQAAAETGIPGLLLQLALLVSCIGASFAASRRFRRRGRPDLGFLARAVGVGQLASLVASTFVSNGADRVFWVLLALGPALLAVAAVAALPGGTDPDADDATAAGPSPADDRPRARRPGANVPAGPGRDRRTRPSRSRHPATAVRARAARV